MGHNAPPPRSEWVPIGVLIVAFLCGLAFNFYLGVFIGTQPSLRHLSWNVPSEHRVFLIIFFSWLFVSALLNILAILGVVRRGFGLKGALFLRFALSFFAYFATRVFGDHVGLGVLAYA